uniref:Lipase EstA/Esterase EstB family-containing protein n=1 Tax=Parastrongyloides trichosuri TaxID=131310 RepID=A0A0N4ZQU7_PARTI
MIMVLNIGLKVLCLTLSLSIFGYCFVKQSIGKINYHYNFPTGPFTNDFVEWLDSKKEFGSNLFINKSLDNKELNTFGGRKFYNDKITKTPIIFFHGNGDGALKNGINEYSSGWSDVISTLELYGYDSSSMYAFTYGDRNMDNAGNREMNCFVTKQFNKFIQSVLLYTNVDKVDVVGHSMGVSILRKAILGENINGKNENCENLPSLVNNIRNFVSISSANYGMCACTKSVSLFMKACGLDFGFYSGSKSENTKDKSNICGLYRYNDGDGRTEDYSTFLKSINDKNIKEGERILSIWSENDEVLGNGNYVWGRKTSLHPQSDCVIIFKGKSHHQTKNDAGNYIFKFINGLNLQ